MTRSFQQTKPNAVAFLRNRNSNLGNKKLTQRRTEDKNLKSKDSKQHEHVPHNNSKQWK